MAKTKKQLVKQYEQQDAWKKEKLDTIRFYTPKGKRDIIKQAARERGLSMNKYINALIDADLEKHPVNPNKITYFR